MRIGQIIKLVPDRKFGFIRTEHFRDDVFFHYSALKDILSLYLDIGQEVEFEINEIMRLDQERLEATIVQYPARPLTKTLDEMAIPELKPAHHPRARQRKPTWREKTKEVVEDTPSVDSSVSKTDDVATPEGASDPSTSGSDNTSL